MKPAPRPKKLCCRRPERSVQRPRPDTLKAAEYAQANENLRFSFSMELAYFRFHVYSAIFLVGAYWAVAEITILRRLISSMGVMLSFSGIVVEYRTITYYRHFFEGILTLERMHKLRQMSLLTKHMNDPPLKLRTSHMIYSIFLIGVFFWVTTLTSDLLSLDWFLTMLNQIVISRRNSPA